jgi:hypothetical protein
MKQKIKNVVKHHTMDSRDIRMNKLCFLVFDLPGTKLEKLSFFLGKITPKRIENS